MCCVVWQYSERSDGCSLVYGMRAHVIRRAVMIVSHAFTKAREGDVIKGMPGIIQWGMLHPSGATAATLAWLGHGVIGSARLPNQAGRV